ncbi:uncharacterized protein LOC132293707 isoform X2 [Cornus florida]|uniref:uncharacterized protein LOC132293707 isoform X2 n=1 Tax=Cornus florida TaxID=4283 RepID=UPI0028A21EBE|nr:uncharacterized protein LOC132293707 isoform X2 [Cornus florida]
MGVELMEIGVKTRRVVIVTTRICYRSVCHHPFLLGMVLFLIFLYRSFPFLFSLLVSASPVFVCTAALLGTLLSLGQLNAPEIRKEEKRPYELRSLKTGVSRDAIVVERDDKFSVERHPGKRRDVVEKSIEKPSSTASNVSDSDGSFVDIAPSIKGNSREIQFEKQVDGAAERKLHDLRFRKKGEMNEEKLRVGIDLEHKYTRIPNEADENIDAEHDKSPVEFFHSPIADDLVTSPVSPWKQVDKEAEDAYEDDDEASYFGSDRAESFSPDTSIADILPMLDELHPLLDIDAPPPAHISHDGSDAASERSLKSSDDINESDEDPENQEEEFGDDDNDDDEEEEMHFGKMDRTKSAITWTEDDQKNLMDLGTSELERNQRLEVLIARRMARKDPKMVAEKNLIDLESSDPAFNIAPISTTRCNPFDLPDDSNDNMGLPPIPGSAPSIFVPRQNPFDLPYYSSVEKPDLMGNSFQQEFMTFHPKDTIFRRHESFNMGPSWVRSPKQEKQEIRFRPYFIPERMPSEGTSYSPFQRQIYTPFQRQLSEISESRTSSVLETESICEAGDHEDEELIYEDLSQEVLVSNTKRASEHVEHGTQSSGVLDSVKLDQVEKREIEPNDVEIKLGDPENHHEMGLSVSEAGGVATLEHNTGEVFLNLSNTKHASEHGEHGAQSSGVSNSVKLDQAEKRQPNEVDIKLGDLENHHEMGSSLSEAGGVATPLEHKTGEVYLNTGAVDNSSKSSSTAFIEVNEKIFYEKEVERLSNLELREGNLIEESAVPMRPLQEESDIHITSGLVDDIQHKEPVYDSSPPAIDIEKDTPSNEEILAGSSQLHAADENVLGLREVTEINEHDVLDVGFSRVDQSVDNANASMVPESVVERASINSEPSSNEVPSSSFGADIHVVFQQDVGENVDSMAFKSRSSGDLNLTAPEEKRPSLVVEKVSDIHHNSSRTESIQEHSVDKVIALQFEHDHQVHSSNSNANFHAGTHQEADENLISTQHPCPSDEKSTLELEKQMPLTNKSMIEISSDNHEKPQELSITQVETIQEISTTSDLKVSEIQEANNTVSSNTYSSITPDPASFPPEVSVTKSTTGVAEVKDNNFDGIKNQKQIQILDHFNHPLEASGSHVSVPNITEVVDEIKEIDEGLLELDTVGDSGVKEFGRNLNEIEKHLVPVVETKSVGTVAGIRTQKLGASSAEEETDPYQEASEILGASRAEEETDLQKNSEVELEHSRINQNPIAEEFNSGIPVLEARSVEEIDSMLRKIGPVSTKTEVELGELEIPYQGQTEVEINSGMLALEARSLEDINSAFKQIREEETKKPIVITSLHTELMREASEPGCSEARSIKDNDLAFKQPHEGMSVEKHVLPSVVDDRHVVKASSLEDPLALKQALGGNPETLLRSNSEDGTAKSEVNVVSSSNEIESSIKESDAVETSTSTAEKPGHGVQTFEALSLSNAEGKKAESHESNSGSSSK